MAEGSRSAVTALSRLALRAIWRVGKDDEVEDVLEDLRTSSRITWPQTGRSAPDHRLCGPRSGSGPNTEEASAARILGTGSRPSGF